MRSATTAREFARLSSITCVELLKAGQDVALAYYRNNVAGTLSLLEAMSLASVKTLVFSSSCTVYGDPGLKCVREDFARMPVHPYGRSKALVEDVLSDLARSDPDWRVCCLRYFNPVGAHASGWIGEDPSGIPNILMPYLLQVAIGRRPELQVFGDDYPTRDGSCIRDFIHVEDVARGHVDALRYLENSAGFPAVNLGTGEGVSVLEMVFETANNISLPSRIVARRPGDVAGCWSDASLARELFGWRAERSILEMCRDAWNWQLKNPNGYVG